MYQEFITIKTHILEIEGMFYNHQIDTTEGMEDTEGKRKLRFKS